MSNVDWRVATAVAKLADAKGLTLRELADRLDLPYRTVQNYLTGEVKIPSLFIAKACDLFAVEADYLMFWGVDVDEKSLAASVRDVFGDVLALFNFDGTNFSINPEKELTKYSQEALRHHQLAIAAQIASALRAAYVDGRIKAIREEAKPGVYPTAQGKSVRGRDPQEFLP